MRSNVAFDGVQRKDVEESGSEGLQKAQQPLVTGNEEKPRTACRRRRRRKTLKKRRGEA